MMSHYRTFANINENCLYVEYTTHITLRPWYVKKGLHYSLLVTGHIVGICPHYKRSLRVQGTVGCDL